MEDTGLTMIDAHVHLVDFLQRGLSPQEVITGLDRAGVDRTVVFGMAVKKKWTIYELRKPDYYLDTTRHASTIPSPTSTSPT